MSDTTQPGVRLDARTWERFRQFVQDRHGGVRGNLRTELEAALENHIDAARGPNELERIESDVATIKAMLAEGEADGGVVAPSPTPSDGSSAPARQDAKPAANATRTKKVEYLTTALIADIDFTRGSGEVSPKDLRNIIEEEYAFEEDTVEDYMDLIVRKLGAEKNPLHGKTYVWGERVGEYEEELREEAGEELEEMA